MTRNDAEQILGALVGATTGWRDAPDETFAAYVNSLSTLSDPTLAAQAVEQIIATWTEARRPPVAVIFATYNDLARRHAMERPALLPALDVCSVPHGRKIAARAYTAECAKRPHTDPLIRSGFRSAEPSARTLNALLGIVGIDDSEDRR